jgi:gamma-glutamyltranspeptidase/glutathione hydrolase
MKLNKQFPIVFVLAIGISTQCISSQAPENTPPGYAVASAHPLATNAGLEILEEGGNAFDAAIAVAATLAVVEPYHTSIGGGGFWLLHQESLHKNTFIDSREVAPEAATKNMFQATDGTVVPGLSLNGGLAAAIPGQPAAFVYLAEHYGKLPLRNSLAPAIRLAREGFPVDTAFHYFSTMGDRLQWLNHYPSTAAIFLKQGKPFVIGDKLVQKDLANTLELIAEQGNDGFYKGKIAELLVSGVNKAGGVWTLKDLAQYKIKMREPLVGAYHNMLVITAPPPSAGGVSLLTMLNILSRYPLPTYTQVQWMHYVIESMRLAYWQRDKFLADPDFVSVPTEQLISAEHAKELADLIPVNKALDNALLQGYKPQKNQVNTTHLSIIDSEGNRVAATLTVNYIFGSSVVAEGTGVLLNDEMDDFATAVGAGNVYGLVGSALNAVAPLKRPLSSMTPTFLELPGRVAILGTPGGSRIPTMVLLASLVFNDGYGAISMASRMRFHHQYLPDLVQFEPDTLPESVQSSLVKMGYQLMPLQQYYGNMQVITWDKKSGVITAASDPRGIGLAESIDGKPSGYGVKY